jgi:hypothetical protein
MFSPQSPTLQPFNPEQALASASLHFPCYARLSTQPSKPSTPPPPCVPRGTCSQAASWRGTVSFIAVAAPPQRQHADGNFRKRTRAADGNFRKRTRAYTHSLSSPSLPLSLSLSLSRSLLSRSGAAVCVCCVSLQPTATHFAAAGRGKDAHSTGHQGRLVARGCIAPPRTDLTQSSVPPTAACPCPCRTFTSGPSARSRRHRRMGLLCRALSPASRRHPRKRREALLTGFSRLPLSHPPLVTDWMSERCVLS